MNGKKKIALFAALLLVVFLAFVGCAGLAVLIFNNDGGAAAPLLLSGAAVAAVVVSIPLYIFAIKRVGPVGKSKVPSGKGKEQSGAQSDIDYSAMRAAIINAKTLRHELHEMNSELEEAKQQRDTDRISGTLIPSAFMIQAEKQIEENPNGTFAMVNLDVSGFKDINETYGYEEGDRLLRYIGNASSSDPDARGKLICRVGADNFYVLDRSGEAVHRASECFAAYMRRYEAPYTVRYRVGVYEIEDKNVPVHQCMKNASVALKKRMSQSDKNIFYFDVQSNEAELREQRLIQDAKQGLADHQFVAYYQPKVDHSTGRIIGAEALARWQHPELGMVSPGEFVPLFERNGLIVELDKQLFEQACVLQRRFLDAGVEPVPISVNMSRLDIIYSSFKEEVEDTLRRYRLDPKYIHIEITETVYTKDPDLLKQVASELKNDGFVIELDDFGSGYSSVKTLMDLSIDVIKLDRGLVQSMSDYKNSLILSSIIRMAKWLGLSIVAEGVEDKELADRLFDLGCKCIQGYYYYRPMPCASFEECIFSQAKTGVLVKDQVRARPVISFESAIIGGIFDVVLTQKNIHAVINTVLEMLGEHYGASRVYIFESNIDGTAVSNTYEWCMSGIEPQKDRLQNVDCIEYLGGNVSEIFDEYGIWYRPDVGRMEAGALRRLLLEQDIKTAIYIAIYEYGEFIGFLGFDHCKSNYEWTTEQIETLRMAAKVISSTVSGAKFVEAKELNVSLKNDGTVLKNQLAKERSKFFDVISNDAVFTVHTDLSEGRVIEDVIIADGSSLLDMLGFGLPAPYDEMCKAFVEVYKVEPISENAERCFRHQEIIRMFGEGKAGVPYDVYLGALDMYVRLNSIIYKHQDTGHLMSYCMISDVSKRYMEVSSLKSRARMSDDFRYALDKSTDQIYIIDRSSYSITYANRATKQHYGEDCIGKTCYSLFMNRNSPCENCPCSYLCNKGESKTKELLLPDGKTISATANTIQYDDKDAIIIYIKDISELKNIKDAELEKSRIIDALSAISITAYINDLSTNTAILLRSSRGESLEFRLDELWERWCSEDVSPEEHRRRIEFLDVNTLPRRMQNCDTLSGTIETRRSGRVRVTLIALQRDEKGTLRRFALVSQQLDDDAHRLVNWQNGSTNGLPGINRQNPRNNILYINEQFNVSAAEYNDILLAAKIGIWALEREDGKPTKMYCNEIMEQLIGVPHGTSPEACYRAYSAGLQPEYKAGIDQYTNEIIKKGSSEITYMWRYPDGHDIVVRCVGVLDRGYDKSGVRMRGYHQDITKSVENHRSLMLQNDELRYEAAHDGQTGLLQRTFAEKQIRQFLDIGGPSTIALVLIDIDRFKKINDTHGHAAGDRALLIVTDMIKAQFSHSDIVARFGGDEFAVFIKDHRNLEALKSRVSRFLRLVSESEKARSEGMTMTCSVGISVAEGGRVDFDTLYRQADKAMYQTKAHGGNGCTVIKINSASTRK